MKELKVRNRSKMSEFMSGKGFYLSLAMSLMLIGATVWTVMNKSIEKTIDNNIKIMKKTEEFQSVNNIVKDVPIKNSKKNKLKNNNDKISDIEKSRKKEVSESKLMPNKENQNVQADLEDESVLFMLPLSGEVSNQFSGKELVKNNTLEEWRTHNGIDINAKQGSAVKSVADGVVSKIYDDPLWGTCIEIDHFCNATSIYCNLNKDVNVKEGDQLEIGHIIGSVGETAIVESGISPHLHLEIKKDGVLVDPLEIMKKAN